MPYSDQFKLKLWQFQDGNCPLCEKEIPSSDALNVELVNIDHILPKSLGGTGRRENLQLAHVPCNTAKGNSYTAPGGVPGPRPWEGKSPIFRGDAPRQVAWRRQGNCCFDCKEIIYPSQVFSPQVTEMAKRKKRNCLVHTFCDPAD